MDSFVNLTQVGNGSVRLGPVRLAMVGVRFGVDSFVNFFEVRLGQPWWDVVRFAIARCGEVTKPRKSENSAGKQAY